MAKVFVSDKLAPQGLEILEQASGIELDYRPGLPHAELLEAVRDAEGLVIRSGTKVGADVIDAAEKLRVIGRAGHRCRQRGRPARYRARDRRGQYARGQQRHHRRARDRAARLPRPAHPSSERLVEGGTLGQEPVHRTGAARAHPRADRARQHRPQSSPSARRVSGCGWWRTTLISAPKQPPGSGSSWWLSTSCWRARTPSAYTSLAPRRRSACWDGTLSRRRAPASSW